MTAILENSASAELVSLGIRLRALRNAQGWTLDDLSKLAGLSKSYLSRLEDGDRQPSIAALLSLAQAHGKSLAALFDSSELGSRYAVVRAGDLPWQQGNGLSYTPLSLPTFTGEMNPIRVVVPADRDGEEMYQHDGEEWLSVLSGKLRLSLSEESIVLHSGDSIHFEARIPHRLAAEGGQDTEILLVACSGKRSLLNSYL